MQNNRFNEIINNSKKIAIFSHLNPDADALCSSCAMKNIIRNNFDDKFVDIFVDGEIGELYDPILRNEVINPKPYNSYDVAIVLDCPNLSRTGKYQEIIKDIPYIINIDHHETNNKFGNLNIVSAKSSSTCEIVCIIALAQKLEMNNIIAKELYQGIITDTNCLTSLSLTARTYQVLSELMKFKFDANLIKEYYFKNNSREKTMLLSKALQSLKFYSNEKFTTMKITNELFSKLGVTFEDTMGLIDNATNIDNTIVSAILIEKEPNKLYCSLRSKGLVNVGEIAKMFNGGGSETVAAFQTEGDIKEVEKALVEKVSPYLESVVVNEKSLF